MGSAGCRKGTAPHVVWVLEKKGAKGKLSSFIYFHVACGILVPRPGIESKPLAVKAPSPNQWTTRDFLKTVFFRFLSFSLFQSVISVSHTHRPHPLGSLALWRGGEGKVLLSLRFCLHKLFPLAGSGSQLLDSCSWELVFS